MEWIRETLSESDFLFLVNGQSRGRIAMAEMDDYLQTLVSDLEDKQEGNSRRNTPSSSPKSSIRLAEQRCVGCAACMRACPTEAIRIRQGKAVVKVHRCIDCGECVRVCEHNAWDILTDPMESIRRFDYLIAVPEASLYGQFAPSVTPDQILSGILDLGFHEIYEAAQATERVSRLLKRYLEEYRGPRPLISSFCPVVVRLIQLRFPELIDLVVPVDAALELAIKDLKEKRSKEKGIPIQRIGAIYLAGCPARITTIHHPYTGGKTYLDGALAVREIYRDLMFAIQRRQREGRAPESLRRASGLGIRWGTLGGEVEALGADNTIAVSEIKHLLRVIEEIDNHMLSDISFIECRACYGGCAGGPLMVDDPYRGRAKIQRISRNLQSASPELCTEEEEDLYHRLKPYMDRRLPALPTETLDPDPSKAIEKLAKRSRILQSLPGIDCGSCGAPNCRALAEDIIRGEANIMYCLFKLRDAFLKQKKTQPPPPREE